MGERVVKVRLSAAATEYISEFKKASQVTRELQTEAEKAAESNRKQTEAMKAVGAGALAMGALVAAGLVYIAKTTADFDASMSQVKSLSHATSAEMGALREAALSAGQGIGMTASQVAAAEIELVKAGVSVKDQLGGGLVGTLNLAAAGQMNVADATQIAASAMTQFKLQGKDVPHIADLLAAGADKALGSVSDLGQGLKYVGPVAQSMGVSIDQTVGSLAMLAQNGILGEMAGTSLRGMLLSLTSPSKLASKTMDELGISVYDAQGKFIGLDGIAEQLHTKLGGLDEATRNQALGQIFGNEQITTATVLMQGGAKAVDEWTNSVNAQGFAAEQAAGKMDNLNGDLSKLQAAFESSVIRSGGGLNEVLRDVVQNTTGVITAIGQLPAPVLEAGVQVGALVAGAALLGGGFLLLLPKMAAVRVELDRLKSSGMSAGKVFGKGAGLTALLMAAAGAASAFGRSASLSAGQMSDLNRAVDSNNIKELDKQFSDVMINSSGFADSMKRLFSDDLSLSGSSAVALNGAVDTLSFGLTHLSQRTDESRAKFAEMGRQLGESARTDYPKATEQFNQYVKALGGGKENVKLALSAFGDYKAALVDMAKEQGISLTYSELLEAAQGKGAYAAQFAAAQQSKNGEVVAEMAGKAKDATDDLNKLVDALNNLGSAALDVSGAQIAFRQAVDDATASLEKNGQNLDINTQAGRDNRSALDEIASAAVRVAGAQAETGASQDALTATIQTGRDAFISAAIQMGMNADEAAALADSYHLVPADVGTLFQTFGVEKATSDAANVRDTANSIPDWRTVNILVSGAYVAIDDINAVNNALSNLPEYKGITVGVNGGVSGLANGAIVEFMAGGGLRGQKLKPMAPIAQMVQPNTWRVVGDRGDVPEMFAPLDGSARSWSIIMQGLQMMPGTPPGFSGQGDSPVYVSASQTYVGAASAATDPGPRFVLEDHSTNYAYDPDEKARAQRTQLTRALDAHGIR